MPPSRDTLEKLLNRRDLSELEAEDLLLQLTDPDRLAGDGGRHPGGSADQGGHCGRSTRIRPRNAPARAPAADPG